MDKHEETSVSCLNTKSSNLDNYIAHLSLSLNLRDMTENP